MRRRRILLALLVVRLVRFVQIDTVAAGECLTRRQRRRRVDEDRVPSLPAPNQHRRRWLRVKRANADGEPKRIECRRCRLDINTVAAGSQSTPSPLAPG